MATDTTQTTAQDEMMDEAIAQAFVAARRRLAPEHHSRLVKAWELVVERAVTLNGDGSATVKGSDQPEYTIAVGGGCTCTDHTSGKAPMQLCKHILAVALQKRSQQKYADLQEASPPAPAVAYDPLPEAPISICMKGTLGGVAGTMVTLRGFSMAEIEARADEVRTRAHALAGMFDETPAPQVVSGVGPTSSETTTAVVSVPTCPDHQTPMKPSKFGGWYCPQTTGDVFCKRKIPAAKKRVPFVPPAAYQPGFRG